jgi:cobalt-zinc-cadmium efflux system protein
MVQVTQNNPVPIPVKIRSCFCGYSHFTAGDRTTTSSKLRLLWTALCLLSLSFATEVALGFHSHSLSLVADAGHMLVDVMALGLTLITAWFAQKPAQGQATFGYRRVEILAALTNGLSLLVIAALIAWESKERLQSPEPILGLPMLLGAGLGLIVNSLNLLLLHRESHQDLNLRGAFLHMMSDAASSVGVILAAIALYCQGWVWMDAAASLLVAGLTFMSAIPLVWESLTVLMEYAPRSINPEQVKQALCAFNSIQTVEKLHIWTIGSGQVALCAHLTIAPSTLIEQDRLLKRLQAYVKQEFGIEEAILQLTSGEFNRPVELHPLLNSNLTSVFARKHGEVAS